MASFRNSPSIYCKYANCQTNSTTQGKRLYRFPKDAERCKQWIEAAKNPKLVSISPAVHYNNSRLCEDHFAEWCFLNATDKHRLVFNALPDVAVQPLTPHNDPDLQSSLTDNDPIADDIDASFSTPMLKISNCISLSACGKSVSDFIQSMSEVNSAELINSPFIPSSRRYRAKEAELAKRIKLQNTQIRKLKRKLVCFKERLNHFKQPKDIFLKRHLIEMGVTEKLVNFIVKQVEHNLAGPQDQRFSVQEKRFAYSILCKSRDAYNLLQTQIELPSESTLRRFLTTKPSAINVCSEVVDSIAKACIDQVEVVIPPESL